MRKGGLEKLMLEGKINGKRQRGRQRLQYLEGLTLATEYGAVDILQRADDSAVLANVRP